MALMNLLQGTNRDRDVEKRRGHSRRGGGLGEWQSRINIYYDHV